MLSSNRPNCGLVRLPPVELFAEVEGVFLLLDSASFGNGLDVAGFLRV